MPNLPSHFLLFWQKHEEHRWRCHNTWLKAPAVALRSQGTLGRAASQSVSIQPPQVGTGTKEHSLPGFAVGLTS